MKRFGLLVVALAPVVSCGGGGGGKPSCDAGDPCGAGSYCAHTPDGNVCWPDAVKPAISEARVACSDTPCRRDSVLHVTATVADESAMGSVTARLDLDPDHPRTLEPGSGSEYAADIPLAELPFPYFEQNVAVTVNATDEARNEAQPVGCAPVAVTRAKWRTQLKGAGDTAFPLFSPAVLPDGRIVVAGSDGSVHFVSTAGAETRSAVAIGSVVSSPPAVGADAIWLATQDGKLHELRFDGSIVSLPSNCYTGQALVGPPAISGNLAFVGSRADVMITADGAGFCTPANAAGTVTSPPLVTASGKVLVATGSVLRSMSLPQSGVLRDDWTGISPAPAAPNLPDTVNMPMAADPNGSVWTTSQNGAVNRTTSAAVTSTLATLSGASAGGVVLADGSVVLSDAARRLVRVTESSSPPWSTSDQLAGVPAVGLVLADPIATIIVPTDQGRVYAIRESDGHIDWSTQLAGQPLQPANIWTEPGATTSTAYLAGADGNLYAIIVDGALDTSAPWPKAFHDPQNTSNAGVTP